MARKPDAILVTHAVIQQLAPGTLPHAHAAFYKNEFGPTLGPGPEGVIRVHPKKVRGHDGHFLVNDGRVDSYQFANGHPFTGQSKYEWWIAERDPSGLWNPVTPCIGLAGETQHVRVGYLRDDPYKVDEEALKKKAAAELAAHMETKKAEPEVQARLAALGHG